MPEKLGSISTRRGEPATAYLCFCRDGLPVPVVELDLCFGRLAHELLDIVRAEGRVATQQDISNDPGHLGQSADLKIVVVSKTYPVDQRSTGFP